MQKITVHTLFDITNTGIIRNFKQVLLQSHPYIKTEKQWKIAKQQQRNVDTLLQIISLRTQCTILNKPRFSKKNPNFKNKVTWKFSFTTEHNEVFSKNNDSLGLLKEDCEHVPMINHLTDKIKDDFFIIDKNIIFEVQNYEL